MLYLFSITVEFFGGRWCELLNLDILSCNLTIVTFKTHYTLDPVNRMGFVLK